jgi:transposase
MKIIYIGADVSKGYADIEFINEAGTRLNGSRRFDDTYDGHAEVAQLLRSWNGPAGPVSYVAGLESTGGLERNWLKFFRGMRREFEVQVQLINPLVIQRFVQLKLHHSITDRISARAIADYLRLGLYADEAEWGDDGLEGWRCLHRTLRHFIVSNAAHQNELQTLLGRVQPELVRYCRRSFPGWVLALLRRYPTAAALAQAAPADVAEIPFLKRTRVAALIVAAGRSVGAQQDEATGRAVTFLAGEISHGNERIAALKQEIITGIKHDEAVQLMRSITGIGWWTAACLRFEIGEIGRFPAAEQLTAFAGLDPRWKISGDGVRAMRISKRGRKELRASLYLPALAASRSNPVIRAFYGRLRAAGKDHNTALVACMRKLLHLVFACWVSGRPFDPDYAAARTAEAAAQPAAETPPEAAAMPARTAAPPLKPEDIEAPVSKKEERRRRRTAALPQAGIHRQGVVLAPPPSAAMIPKQRVRAKGAD